MLSVQLLIGTTQIIIFVRFKKIKMWCKLISFCIKVDFTDLLLQFLLCVFFVSLGVSQNPRLIVRGRQQS